MPLNIYFQSSNNVWKLFLWKASKPYNPKDWAWNFQLRKYPWLIQIATYVGLETTCGLFKASIIGFFPLPCPEILQFRNLCIALLYYIHCIRFLYYALNTWHRTCSSSQNNLKGYRSNPYTPSNILHRSPSAHSNSVRLSSVKQFKQY